MKSILLYVFVLTLGYTSFAQKTLNKRSKEIIRSEIETMFKNYHNAIVKDGLEAEFKYLDDSDDFFWVPPGYESSLDYKTVKKILLENSKATDYMEFSWETIKIFPISNKIATYSGIVRCVMVDTTNTPMTFRIIESGTLIKRKNGWKFLSGQSRNLPKN